MGYFAKYPVDYKNHECRDKCSADMLYIHAYCKELHKDCKCCPDKVKELDEPNT